MKTVSFDFDNTLWDEDMQSFIPETVALLRQHQSEGNRIIIVTSRVSQWIPEVHTLLNKLNLKLEVFCACGDPGWEIEGELTKSQVLIAEGASIHWDDLHEDACLQEAKKHGIEVLLPPNTKVEFPRMY